MKIQPVILAGGVGTRLWPLSKADMPKQFCLFDEGFSLFQNTLIRNAIFGKPIVIINQIHQHIALKQIEEVGLECLVLVEPISKGSAVCSVLAAIISSINQCNCTLLLPSDHIIKNTGAYVQAVNKAARFSPHSAALTLGIKPTSPNTHYGYVELGEQVASELYRSNYFIEKPDQESANLYYSQQNFLWNSGIFLYDPDKFLSIARQVEPELTQIAYDAWKTQKQRKSCVYLAQELYGQITKPNSLDYAFIEHLELLHVVEGKFIWSDLGNYHSLFDSMDKDANNNHI